MSNKYRGELLNMFERSIKADKNTPAMGNHPNYRQPISGGSKGIYGNEQDLGGCKCCEGSGLMGGDLRYDNEQDKKSNIRGVIYNYLKRRSDATTNGGSYGGAYDDSLNGSVQTPELSKNQYKQYYNLEVDRYRGYNPYAKKIDTSVPIKNPEATKEMQQIIYDTKVRNDAQFDETHGRGMYGGKKPKKVKNPNRVAAGKNATKKNTWISFVKGYCELNGKCYRDAIKDPEVKKLYDRRK